MYTDLALFIDGAFLSGEGRDSEPVLNPATGQVLAQLPHATGADLERALTSAAAVFPIWRRTSAYDRGGILKRAAGLIRERYPGLPVVLTSGYSNVLAENTHHGFELIQKPYSVESLSRVLRKAIAERTPVVR